MSAVRYLADEDLRRQIVTAVRRAESTIELMTVVELGLSGADDPDVLEFAQANRWLVVSHDVNTMRAAAEWRLSEGLLIAGLFLAPQARSTREVTESLVLIWSASELEEWENRIVYLPL